MISSLRQAKLQELVELIQTKLQEIKRAKERDACPFIFRETIISGITRQIRLGRKSFIMILPAVICPPIQSIVVVTSPIGDQAPPAFAAITTIPTYHSLFSCSLTSFLIKVTITMVVFKLSSTGERKNVIKHTIQRSFRWLV